MLNILTYAQIIKHKHLVFNAAGQKWLNELPDLQFSRNYNPSTHNNEADSPNKFS